MENTLLTSLIANRRSVIADWLDDYAPYSCADQRHLDAGTPEQAYWHLGYLSALNDILARLTDADSYPSNADTASQSPPDALDGRDSQAD